jgi:predicted nucleotidyltransferase
MLDLDALRTFVHAQPIAPLFVTISGAHLYGFPSPDSDIDLRGCHLAPLRDIVGIDHPAPTVEPRAIVGGIEVEMVSHEFGKYLRLLLKNNGYVLEQIFSPLVVVGDAFLATLRPLARRCITRHHYHHYRGFLATERKLLDKQEPKSVKAVLYAYRVVLTGMHLLRSGEVEANLVRLAESAGLPFVAELIALKKAEKATAAGLNWSFHGDQLTRLGVELDAAYRDSTLPDERDRRAVHDFLVGLRLSEPLRERWR